MSDPPSSIDFAADCEICGGAASWRSTPKAGETVFTAIVIACINCGFVWVDPSKAVVPPSVRSVLGRLTERITG